MESPAFPPPSSTDTGIDGHGVLAVPVAGPPSASAAAEATPQGGKRSFFARRPRRVEPPDAAAPAAGAVPPEPRRRRSRTLRVEAPAWAVSLAMHAAILGTLAMATLAPEVRQAVRNLNASMVDTGLSKSQAEELVHIYADPSNAPRDQAVGEVSVSATPGVAGGGLGTGSGPPSATPRVGVSTSVGERTSLPGVRAISKLSGLAMLPGGAALTRDLSASAGGSGAIGGDVTHETKDIGQALDQLAREILRHLEKHKLTVVWMFDESGSMKDDQQAVRDKFSRVSTELKLNVDNNKKSAGALNHVIVGFGDGLHAYQEKPTADIDAIGKAITRLKVDETGVENTCQAIGAVVNRYGRLISDERRMLLVLVTDESGDDGSYVEEARQALLSRGVALYVIGRQSLFGYDRAHLLYIDPVTKDHYYPTIKRGPETAERECLQWDGLHERNDEQPSGFAPYELARLAKDSGGIYFLLPSEENMRVRQREKAYSIATMKEYVPSYESRASYNARAEKSELRRTLLETIRQTKGLSYRHGYPIDPAALQQAILEEVPKVRERLTLLGAIENRLRAIQKLRDREPDKRWQAHYDLILGQVVAYQVKGYEYLACIDEMVALAKKGRLKPKTVPIPGKVDVGWGIGHSTTPKAPKAETEKHYAEAKRLLDLVIARHPKTPWADLAQDTINRGFSCGWGEEAHTHSPQYAERAKLVPKY